MEKPSNYASFYALLNRMQSRDKEGLKESIVLQYTFGRTTSLREMTSTEYLSALRGMQRLLVPPANETGILRHKRSEVLHQMQLLGINTADWQRVNDFCLHRQIAGKAFAKLNIDELEVLTKKLRAILRKGGLPALHKETVVKKDGRAVVISVPIDNLLEC